MPATFIGVRHHSPACARLVAATIAALRPAHVLVEGPADLNDRVDELLLGHELPVAVFSSYRDAERQQASWAPFCAYSPEWVALTAGRQVGARVRFIDLPSWDQAFAGRENRYADAEQRYADAVDRLLAAFGVDNVDTLWDHLFEIEPDDGIDKRLAAYFDLLRGESTAGESDTAREAYMARWVRAAVHDAGDRPVVVVIGGFHRPALIRLAASGDGVWPEVPTLPRGAVGGSYLVPYSFRRLDAFDGYQSGMPSPEYYQRLWDHGPQRAATDLLETVVGRLRERRQPVSTADLVAARTSAAGLALVRGHRQPARTDVLDGLATALINEALDVPLPWATRGRLREGNHPAVVEMVAALSGSRVGRLHPDTPLPPLVHQVTAELERHGIDDAGTMALDLTEERDRRRSRVLHRLRVLQIPGYTREHGPTTGVDAVLDERWTVGRHEHRLPALIEAGGFGATLEEAAAAALAERVRAVDRDVEALAGVLFDAALCGIESLSDRVLDDIARMIGTAPALGPLGRVLAVVLALWRHGRLLGAARTAPLGAAITASVDRVLWLVEGARGGSAADPYRIGALVATRDAIVHAGAALGLDPAVALAVTGRLAADRDAPPDLRGAGFGFGWSLGAGGPDHDPVRAVRGAGAPGTVGDWLAGLFALAREDVLHAAGVLDLLDELVGRFGEEEFLIALPALRQAFTYFPPRERETIARHVLARRGEGGSGRSLLRLDASPDLFAAGVAVDARVDAALRRAGLLSTEERA